MTIRDYDAEVKWGGKFYRFSVLDLEVPACKACGELVFTEKVDDQIQSCLETLLSTTLPNKGRNNDGAE